MVKKRNMYQKQKYKQGNYQRQGKFMNRQNKYRNVQQVYIDYYVQTDVCVEKYVQTNMYVHVQSSMEKSKTVLGLKNGQV